MEMASTYMSRICFGHGLTGLLSLPTAAYGKAGRGAAEIWRKGKHAIFISTSSSTSFESEFP